MWELEDKKTCRGFIATPLIAEPFEVDLAHSNPHRPKPGHSTDHCQTTYPTESIVNPITGLVVHPVGLQTVSPPVIPLYTAVRLSATATNTSWWESSLPQRQDQREEPQWATEIQKRITNKVSLDQADQVGDGGSESGDDGVEHDEDMEKKDNDDNSEDEDEEENDGDNDGSRSSHHRNKGDFATHVRPEVYPQRMLLWGLATSPGGGSTAVLASPQLTQKPERGTWNHYHSQIFFDFSNRRGKPLPPTGEAAEYIATGAAEYDENNGADNAANTMEGLSTEARLWEWLYGGGPGVPALTYYAAASSHPTTTAPSNNFRITAHQTKDAEAQANRDRIKSLFTSLVALQTCGICADGRTKLLFQHSSNSNNYKNEGGRQLDTACEQGHRVAVCGTSGLAIMKPGISRCCGVCQSRCLDVDVLLRMLDTAGKKEEAEIVRREVNEDLCVRCGGKYLD